MKKYLVIFFLLLFSLSFLAFAKDRIVGVEVKGNTTTKKFVVLNLLDYTKNMKLDIDALEISQNALLNSGLFSDIYMDLKPTGDDYILVVNLKEKAHFIPVIDLEKGVGIENNDLFGLGVGMYGTLRFFNLSPFSVFWGGYTVGMSSPRAFGTHFSFKAEYGDLKNLYWQAPAKSFYYDSQGFTVGLGYEWDAGNLFMASYMSKTNSSTNLSQADSNVNSISFVLKHISYFGEGRSYLKWNAGLERGVNEDFTTLNLDMRYYYRIIAQIYTLTRSYSVYNGENTPLMSKYYFGQTSDLKGYDLREFSTPFMSLLEERIGVPFTSSFKISKSSQMTFLTPEIILQGAFIKSEEFSLNDFKFSIGIGIKFKTPVGSLEPELFFGKSLKFYLEF